MYHISRQTPHSNISALRSLAALEIRSGSLVRDQLARHDQKRENFESFPDEIKRLSKNATLSRA